MIVPIAGLSGEECLTALTAAVLAGDDTDVVFCAFEETDPAVAIVGAGLARRPDPAVKLLIGRQRVSANPKMDNIEKALSVVKADLVVCVDGNVEVPSDMITRLIDCWDSRIGLVSSPPVGIRPGNFWAEVECAFLNTGQARWQLAADQLGSGFAHGKVLAFRRSLLDRSGGLERLYGETAEDAAATKLVRAAGLEVRLSQRPFEQPIGRRDWREVWNRNLRWARLRRQSYPTVYGTEIFNTILAPLFAGAGLAGLLGWPQGLMAAAVIAFWYGTETWLALAASWYWRPRLIAAFVVRDIMAPAIWIRAWFGRTYVWRGQSVRMNDPSI